jgi:murein DD-endopeptidase MepM/ murein hydrolase activator NlpD
LVAALDSAEQRYSKIRQMLGADIVPDPVSLSTPLPVAPAVRARIPEGPVRFETGSSVPRHWPLDDPGYVTQGQVGTGTMDEQHPGLDIAVPIGTMVRASGGGTVLRTGTDAEYGTFVLLQHRGISVHVRALGPDDGSGWAAGERGRGHRALREQRPLQRTSPSLRDTPNGQSLDPTTLLGGS